ncbi:MAG: hypothetical protein QOE35_951 [Actinomycetota bacterium]|jgi:hypothetical protein
MHDFLITILLGLALFKIVDLLEEVMPGVTRLHSVVTLVLALAGVWFLDYSMFKGFDIALRNADMGVWVTGLFVAGATSVWRAMFHWLGSSEGEEPAVRHMHSARAA